MYKRTVQVNIEKAHYYISSTPYTTCAHILPLNKINVGFIIHVAVDNWKNLKFISFNIKPCIVPHLFII